MIIFLIILITYIGLLILIKPSPMSLKATPITYSENFQAVWASICSGGLIILVFLLTTNFGFISIDERMYRMFSLSNELDQFLKWPLQLATHLFIHFNLIHLIGNVIGLGLASAYERKVGANRYFAVLFVGSLASIPSILFYSENVLISGISGGVFGLAAAYFTDEKELTTKEWLFAISLFLFLAVMFTLDSEFGDVSNEALGMEIDHIGHFMGAIGAILYCRLNSLSLNRQLEVS